MYVADHRLLSVCTYAFDGVGGGHVNGGHISETSITIENGTITAIGREGAAGIGGGEYGSGGTIKITGGNVHAEGGSGAAGIGAAAVTATAETSP